MNGIYRKHVNQLQTYKCVYKQSCLWLFTMPQLKKNGQILLHVCVIEDSWIIFLIKQSMFSTSFACCILCYVAKRTTIMFLIVCGLDKSLGPFENIVTCIRRIFKWTLWISCKKLDLYPLISLLYDFCNPDAYNNTAN